ncbi:MAG: hypothetical protein IKL90_02655 [Alphaproteobacteria bacterium]|nr:hypothetical protein [Alphaproteobacteria bacterium]
MLNLFRFKIFYAIVLFLCCLAIFLYGVSWVTVLFTNIHRYAWTNIQLIHYKTFIILLIPILIWGCWWSLYVLKNQNEIAIHKTKASLLEASSHDEIYKKISLLSSMLNIPMPKLYQVSDMGVNSLLISNSKNESALIFSSYIINSNNVNHIINMATFHLASIQTRANAFNTFVIALTSCFSHWFEIIMLRFFKTRELPFHLERFHPLLYPIRFVLLPLISILSIFALYDRLIAPIITFLCIKDLTLKKDKKAILLLKTPQKYINTLYLVQDNPRVSAFENGAMFISCFQDPRDHLVFLKLIDTHPSIEKRIQKIKKEFKAYFIYEKEEE